MQLLPFSLDAHFWSLESPSTKSSCPEAAVLCGSQAMYEGHMQVCWQPQLSPTFESSRNLHIIPFLSCWLPSSCLDPLSWGLRHHGIEWRHFHYALPKSLAHKIHECNKMVVYATKFWGRDNWNILIFICSLQQRQGTGKYAEVSPVWSVPLQSSNVETCGSQEEEPEELRAKRVTSRIEQS